MPDVLARLRGGLIVSVQAGIGSPLRDPRVIGALARAAQDGGAVGVRIEGTAMLGAVRALIDVPIIGLIKRTYPGFDPYITPTLAEVDAIAASGAEIVAFDATGRPRPDGSDLAHAIERIHLAGAIAMADCATADDAVCAYGAGAEIVATTLCGYTLQTGVRSLPALDLVREMAELDAFVICEGGVTSPHELRSALDAGADAVVVGTAITGIEARVRGFAGAADTARKA